MIASEWQQDRLFDRWDLTDFWEPKEFVWPEEMGIDWKVTREKERWGVLTARRAIFEAMPGARVLHRGDAVVWEEHGDGSILVQGDIDVAWEGRSPIFEVKTYAPATRLRQGRAPASQGLDWSRYRDYLNEQERSGRPFYVVWVWPDVETRTRVVRGKRIDTLSWPPQEESLNRLRNVKGAKMAYWYIDQLWTMREIASDVEAWGGAPYQSELAFV